MNKIHLPVDAQGEDPVIKIIYLPVFLLQATSVNTHPVRGSVGAKSFLPAWGWGATKSISWGAKTRFPWTACVCVCVCVCVCACVCVCVCVCACECMHHLTILYMTTSFSLLYLVVWVVVKGAAGEGGEEEVGDVGEGEVDPVGVVEEVGGAGEGVRGKDVCLCPGEVVVLGDHDEEASELSPNQQFSLQPAQIQQHF